MMRAGVIVALFLVACGGKTTSAVDGDASPGSDVGRDEVAIEDGDLPPPFDGDLPPSDEGVPDLGPPGGTCDLTDPENPPIECRPDAPLCSSTERVGSCPTDTPCMATVKATSSTYSLRVGRLRLWAPDALLSLTGIAIDPHVRARCANAGTEMLSLLFRFDLTASTVQMGGARPSSDGKSFAFANNESVTAASAAAMCPGFVGPSTPLSLAPVRVSFGGSGLAAIAMVPQLTIPIFDSGGVWAIPLRDVRLRVPSFNANGSCIGAWDRRYWCDGDSEGWTTGASLVGKITAEDADRVPIKSAGCQSLCAILVNDATKTDGKVCKRVNGVIPEIGTTCVGGTSCKNAFVFSTTFGAYGVSITN